MVYGCLEINYTYYKKNEDVVVSVTHLKDLFLKIVMFVYV